MQSGKDRPPGNLHHVSQIECDVATRFDSGSVHQTNLPAIHKQADTNAGLAQKPLEACLWAGLPPARLQGGNAVEVGSRYRIDLNLIFANPDGTPLKPDSVSASVSALFKRLKIPKPKGAGLHLLRHTHTSHLLASGVPLPAVSARLGHSSIRTTQEIYAHMIPGQDDAAAQMWEEYQRKNLPEDSEGVQ